MEAVVNNERAEARVLELASQFIDRTLEEVVTKDKLMEAAGVNPIQYETKNLLN